MRDLRKFSRSLLALRMLLLKDPDLMALMDHNEKRRREEPELWEHFQKNVVGYLLDGKRCEIARTTT